MIAALLVCGFSSANRAIKRGKEMVLKDTTYILRARSKVFCFKSLLISFLFVYVTANNAHSQQLTGIIADSLGGAGSVAAEATEAHLINPATLPHSKSMTVDMFYRAGDLTKEIDESTFSVGVVDNTEGLLIPGGITYAKTSRKLVGFSAIEEEFIQVSVGQFIGNQISVGGSLVTLSQEVSGDKDYRQWDASVGVMWNPAPHYALGLSYLYFAEAPEDTPEALNLASTWVLGTSYILTEYARFRLDITRPKQPTGDSKPVYKNWT